MKSLDQIEKALKAKADAGDADAKAKLQEFYVKRSALQERERSARLYRMIVMFVNEEFITPDEAKRLLAVIKKDPTNLARIQEELSQVTIPAEP